MFNEYSKYGAITTKVRAMHGRRLKASDWNNLQSMRSVSSVIGYLKKHPGWANALSTLPAISRDRSEIELMLRDSLEADYSKLYKFSSLNDKLLLQLPIYKFECRAILARLRTLMSGSPAATLYNTSDFTKSKSKLEFGALSVADTWNALLSAVKNTIFHQPLSAIQAPHTSNLPDYTAVSVLIEGRCYEVAMKTISNRYKGSAKKVFLQSLGQDVDLLNIIHIMRIKRYFPQTTQLTSSLLFPVKYKLKASFFEELSAASDYDRAMSLLNTTYYGKFFHTHTFDKIDDYYKEKVIAFNRKQLMNAAPSPYIAYAYLILKEQEITRLISIIEHAFYAETNLLKQ